MVSEGTTVLHEKVPRFHEMAEMACFMFVPCEMAHVCSVRDGVPCEMAHTQNMFRCFMCVPSFVEGIATHKRDLLFRGWLRRREEMVCHVCVISHGGCGYTHTDDMFHLCAIAHSYVYV